MLTLIVSLLATASAADLTEAEVLSFVAQHAPDKHIQLLHLKDTSPDQYEEMIEQIAAHIASKQEYRAEILADKAELRARMQALKSRYADATAAEQIEIRAELEIMAGEWFDLRQQLRREKLEGIREQVSRLEAEISEQEAQREALISAYLDKALEP